MSSLKYGISVQVLLPSDASLNFTNLRVWAFWEVSQTEGNADAADCSPEELKGPLVLGPWDGRLKPLMYFHSGLVITGIFEIPVRVILFHLSYISDKEHSKAVRGWLIIPAVISHLGRAAGVPGTVSTAPHLSFPKLPSMIKRYFTTNPLWKGLSRPEQKEGGMNRCTHTCFPPCQTSACLGFREMKPLLCTDLAAFKWLLGRWESWSPLSIQRTGFGLLTSHIAVSSRRAIPVLGVLLIKKLKEYFWSKGPEAAELQGKLQERPWKALATLLLKIPL